MGCGWPDFVGSWIFTLDTKPAVCWMASPPASETIPKTPDGHTSSRPFFLETLKNHYPIQSYWLGDRDSHHGFWTIPSKPGACSTIPFINQSTMVFLMVYLWAIFRPGRRSAGSIMVATSFTYSYVPWLMNYRSGTWGCSWEYEGVYPWIPLVRTPKGIKLGCNHDDNPYFFCGLNPEVWSKCGR